MLQLLEELLDPKRDGSCRAIVLAQQLGREVALLARQQLHQSRRLPVPAHGAQTAQPGRARGRYGEHVVGANEGLDRGERRPRGLLVAVLVQTVYQKHQSLVGQCFDEGVLQFALGNERSERLSDHLRQRHFALLLRRETAPECKWDEQRYAHTEPVMDRGEQFRCLHQVEREAPKNRALARAGRAREQQRAFALQQPVVETQRKASRTIPSVDCGSR